MHLHVHVYVARTSVDPSTDERLPIARAELAAAATAAWQRYSARLRAETTEALGIGWDPLPEDPAESAADEVRVVGLPRALHVTGGGVGRLPRLLRTARADHGGRPRRHDRSTACVWVTFATARPSASRSSVSTTMTVRPTCSGRATASTCPAAHTAQEVRRRADRGRAGGAFGEVEERAEPARRVREAHERAAVQQPARGAARRRATSSRSRTSAGATATAVAPSSAVNGMAACSAAVSQLRSAHLREQDLALEAVGVAEERAVGAAEVVDVPVARPGRDEPLADHVERVARRRPGARSGRCARVPTSGSADPARCCPRS